MLVNCVVDTIRFSSYMHQIKILCCFVYNHQGYVMCISRNPSLRNVSNRKGKTISSKEFFSKYVCLF